MELIYTGIEYSYFKEEINCALKRHCTFQRNSLFFIFNQNNSEK